MPGEDLSDYYTIPVILSMAGVEKQVNDQLGKVGVTGGKKIGQGLAEGLKSSEAELKQIFDGVSKMQDKAADATGRRKTAEAGLQDLVDKGITSGQRYVRISEQIEKAKRDETRATKAAEAALKDYELAAKDAGGAGEKASAGLLSGLRGAAAGAGSAGSDAAASFAEGFAGSSALLRLGAVGGPAGIAVAAAGAVLGGVFVQNLMAGIEREPARDLVQAQLGVDDATIARLGQETGEIYARNFGESRAEVMEAGKLAIQQGLIDPQAPAETWDPVIEKLLSINQLIGGDITQTTNTVRTLWKSGVTKDIEGAFDVITAASQRGLGDDIMDSLTEYSVGWKNAGLSAEQALALIKQAQDNGVDNSDRAADALREFGRRITEEGPSMVAMIDAIGLNGQAMYDKFKQGGPAAFEAFDTVFDKIRSIKDPVDRNAAAMALLGDTAGDFISAFAQWDPSAAVQGFNDIDGAADNASRTMGDNLVGSWESAKRTIEVALDGVQDSLADAFGPALTDLLKNVTDNKDEIADFFVTVGEYALDGAEVVIKSLGKLTEGIGLFIGGIGNIQGSILRFEAWQAEIRGDGELADELHRQSEEAYGWGDSLKDAGVAMAGSVDDIDELKGKLRDLRDDTDDADTSTGNLGQSINTLGDNIRGLPTALPSWFTDLGTGTSSQPPTIAPGSDPFAIPGGPGYQTAPSGATVIDGLAPTGGGGQGVGINLQAALGNHKIYNGPATEDTGGAIVPRNAVLQDAVTQAFPGTQINNDYRVPDGFNEHSSGEAVDIAANPDGSLGKQTPEGQARGSAINAWLLKNADALGLEYTIWQGKNWRPDGSTSPNSGSGVTGGHWDHVHARVRGGALNTGPGVAPHGDLDPSGLSAGQNQSLSIPATLSSNTTSTAGADWDTMAMKESSGNWAINTGNGYSGGLQFTPETWAANKPAGAPAEAWQATREQQIAAGENVLKSQGPGAWPNTFTPASSSTVAVGPNGATGPVSPNVINAWGAGYEPGMGTPGYNEYGEPGYYETDPRRIAQAQRSAEDSQRRISDTESAITDSDATLADAIAERDRIAKMTAVQREAEKADLDKANADVDRAQKQADKSRLDAQRAKEDAKWAQEDFAEAQQGTFKQAREAKKPGKAGSSGGSELGELGSIASSFLGDTFGFGSFLPALNDNPWVKSLDAGLSAFLPMLTGGDAATAGTSTASGPFGLPDPMAPPMPPDGVHTGAGGAPGPIVNVDASQNFGPGSTVGWDPREAEKRQKQNAARVMPRIPVG